MNPMILIIYNVIKFCSSILCSKFILKYVSVLFFEKEAVVGNILDDAQKWEIVS